MTVEELIEELRGMPQTAIVFVKAPPVESYEIDELLDCPIGAVVYDHGEVSIRLELEPALLDGEE